MEQIPYIAHEADMTRMERMNRRLWILNIILILILLATNAGWLIYESQFEEVTSTSYSQDIDATADDGSDLDLTTVGGDYYGSESENKTDGNNN